MGFIQNIKEKNKNLTEDEKRERIHHIRLVPVILMLGYVPLLIGAHTFNNHLGLLDWGADSMSTDFFLYYKSVAMGILAAVMALWTIGRLMRGDEGEEMFAPMPRSSWLMGVYLVFVLFSGLVTEYRALAFGGAMDLFQTVPATMAYAITLWYGYANIRDEGCVRFVLKGAAPGVFILLLIATFQGFGLDFFTTPIGKSLLLSDFSFKNLDSVTLRAAVAATLYNEDNFSFYVPIIMAVSFALAFKAKDNRHRIVPGLIFLMTWVVFFTGHIDTTYFSTAAMIGMVIVVWFCRTPKRLKVGISLAVCGAALLVVTLVAVAPIRNAIANRLFLYDFDRGIYELDDIETGDKNIIFKYLNGHEMTVAYSYDDTNGLVVQALDDNGDQIQLDTVYASDNTYLTTVTKDYGTVKFSIGADSTGNAMLLANMNGTQFKFTNQADEQGTYYYVNDALKCKKFERGNYNHIFPEVMFSNRGWIWNTTSEMLPKTMLLGVGSNIFMFEFPHDDLHYAYDSSIDVKPHDLYLQEWTEQGFIAFAAWFIFYVLYFIDSLLIYSRADWNRHLVLLGLACFVGTVGYMVAGIAADSNVCTAPVYWSVWGIGLAINRIIKDKEEEYYV